MEARLASGRTSGSLRRVWPYQRARVSTITCAEFHTQSSGWQRAQEVKDAFLGRRRGSSTWQSAGACGVLPFEVAFRYLPMQKDLLSRGSRSLGSLGGSGDESQKRGCRARSTQADGVLVQEQPVGRSLEWGFIPPLVFGRRLSCSCYVLVWQSSGGFMPVLVEPILAYIRSPTAPR